MRELVMEPTGWRGAEREFKDTALAGVDIIRTRTIAQMRRAERQDGRNRARGISGRRETLCGRAAAPRCSYADIARSCESRARRWPQPQKQTSSGVCECGLPETRRASHLSSSDEAAVRLGETTSPKLAAAPPIARDNRRRRRQRVKKRRYWKSRRAPHANAQRGGGGRTARTLRVADEASAALENVDPVGRATTLRACVGGAELAAGFDVDQSPAHVLAEVEAGSRRVG